MLGPGVLLCWHELGESSQYKQNDSLHVNHHGSGDHVLDVNSVVQWSLRFVSGEDCKGLIWGSEACHQGVSKHQGYRAWIHANRHYK